MPTDIQFKDDLRKELIMYEDYLDLLKNGEIEKLKKKFEDNIKRINESLQDQCIVRGADQRKRSALLQYALSQIACESHSYVIEWRCI